MKRISVIIMMSFATNFLFAQSSYVYKRNPATNQLEVFESQNGVPIGAALFQIQKNNFGYIEITNLKGTSTSPFSNVTTDPFTNKPDYSIYKFRQYQLPVQQIVQTLETLNKRYEYDYVMANPEKNSSNAVKEFEKNYFQKRSDIANEYFNFYNGNISFPKTLKDGWFDVVNIFDNGNSNESGEKGKDYKYGICKVQSNKIVEYYENCNMFDLKDGFVFQKIKIEVISPISNCKCSFRSFRSNSYSTLYFLDNILDNSKQIQNPEFSLFSIFTSLDISSQKRLVVQIARNQIISNTDVTEFKAGVYMTQLTESNPESHNCNNSLMTLAFRKSNDQFSIGIYQTTENYVNGPVWIQNNLKFKIGNCESMLIQ